MFKYQYDNRIWLLIAALLMKYLKHSATWRYNEVWQISQTGKDEPVSVVVTAFSCKNQWANLIMKFNSRVMTLLLNKPYWFDVANHTINFNQSQGNISE